MYIHLHMYVYENTFPDTPACEMGGILAELLYPASNRERWRSIVCERMSTTVLSTFLCPYMVVNHVGEGVAIASLSVWHVTWKQEVLWCTREVRKEGKKGLLRCAVDRHWTISLYPPKQWHSNITPSVGHSAYICSLFTFWSLGIKQFDLQWVQH